MHAVCARGMPVTGASTGENVLEEPDIGTGLHQLLPFLDGGPYPAHAQATEPVEAESCHGVCSSGC